MSKNGTDLRVVEIQCTLAVAKKVVFFIFTKQCYAKNETQLAWMVHRIRAAYTAFEYSVLCRNKAIVHCRLYHWHPLPDGFVLSWHPPLSL